MTTTVLQCILENIGKSFILKTKYPEGEKMIEVAVIEDDALAREKIVNYFERYSSETGEEFRPVCFSSAVDFLTNFKANYGIVCMDIDLPDMDGMTASKKLRQIDSTVCLIFITNMAQFAVRGYEVDATDFMIKPVSYPNFALKIGRAAERIKTAANKIMINNKQGVRVIYASDVKYVEVMGHTLSFHLKDETVVAWGTLKKYEEELKDYGFSRCNSCYLVNLRYVRGVNDFDAFVDDEKLQISYSRKKQFLADMADYLGGKS